MIKIQLFFLALIASRLLMGQTPEDLANEQLEAYNNRDIEAFLMPYSDSVKVFDKRQRLLYQGKARMREQYAGMFDRITALTCVLINRIAVNNTVIDHEEVRLGKNQKIHAIVMYKVAKQKIQEVHFLDR